ncbi:MAG: hypothetical protein PWQ85_1078 [Geotoga sp.]|nr:hypothetical protein [Geotoga sp.]
MARPERLELPTFGLEIQCSILLSYGRWSGRRESNPQPSAWKADTLPIELQPRVIIFWSERLGSNQRPPVPKTGALPTALRSVFIRCPRYIISQILIFVNYYFFQILLKNVNFEYYSVLGYFYKVFSIARAIKLAKINTLPCSQ